jgi:hypothetical protein
VVDPFWVTLDRLTVCVNLPCNYDKDYLSYHSDLSSIHLIWGTFEMLKPDTRQFDLSLRILVRTMEQNGTTPPRRRRNVTGLPERVSADVNSGRVEHDHDHAETDPVLMFFGISCVLAVVLGAVYLVFHKLYIS